MGSISLFRSIRKFTWTSALAFGASLAVAAQQAQGSPGPIGVEFVQGGVALTANQVAGVLPQGNFNPVPIANSVGTSGTTGGLMDALGNPTAITLTHVSNDGYLSNIATTTPNGILLHGEDKTGPTGRVLNLNLGLSATYTFNNVPSGQYELIAYIENDWAGINANIVVGATTYYVTEEAIGSLPDNGPLPVPQFSLANNTNPALRVTGNYVEFDNISPVAGQIALTDISEGGGNDTVAIDGFQLVAVPEPSSALLLMVGALVLLTAKTNKLRRCCERIS